MRIKKSLKRKLRKRKIQLRKNRIIGRPSDKPKLKLLPRYASRKKTIAQKYIIGIYSKSICSKIDFSNITFINTNLRGSIFKQTKFNGSKFICSDFNGVHFNCIKFKNTEFKKCLFYGTVFKRSTFDNCQFKECIFINVKTEALPELNKTNIVLKRHPYVTLSTGFIEKLNKFKKIEHLTKSRLIHIKGGKINHATFYAITTLFNNKEETVVLSLEKIFEKQGKKTPYTVGSLIENLKKIDS
ncbi:pentapeptide repeat-containing protein [Pectobacterium colocasium]|uniref:pentapeptide repeat-containing protein n=1 Tax=Pectobacterium colocasium TaxID=2878098 RepID=UPI001CD65EF6|nr:pentapeptide repeat-containing protein [Pectobacterium colocasium]